MSRQICFCPFSFVAKFGKFADGHHDEKRVGRKQIVFAKNCNEYFLECIVVNKTQHA